MDFALLYRIQDYYLVTTEVEKGIDESPCVKNRLMYPIAAVEDIIGQAPTIFSHILGDSYDGTYRYYKCFEIEQHLYLVSYTLREYFQLALDKTRIETIADSHIANFRLIVRQRLIATLSSEKGTLNDVLAGYACYTRHDEYSLWIYNEETEVFTFVTGSKKPELEYIMPEEDTRLRLAIAKNYTSHSGEPHFCQRGKNIQAGMQSYTRMKLNLGPHHQPGVLTFYSRYKDFNMQSQVISDICALVEMKYQHQLKGAARGLENTTQALLSKEREGKAVYFHTLTECLCTQLQYESAAVFMVDTQDNHIDVLSIFDNDSKGPPEQHPIVQHDTKSLLQEVIDEPEAIHLIYDLDDEQWQGSIYPCATDNAPRNWIAAAIKHEGRVCAVVTVMNKYIVDYAQNKQVVAPRPSDYYNIATLQSVVTSYLSSQLKMEQLQRRLENHDNLAKVYRHEIRGPVGSIVAIPGELIGALQKHPLSNESIDRIIKRLEDLEALTSNLQMIAKTYDVERLISDDKGDGESLSLLKDIIFPIDKLTKRYYRTRYLSHLVIDHDSIRGAKVYGKEELYRMVLYALLDNAGKYQEDEDGGLIKIYGRYAEKDDFIYLYVENNGLEILAQESELIFENDVRGQTARDVHIDGSGIGLWLASKIMNKYNGKIELESRYNPVIFKLTIPTGVA